MDKLLLKWFNRRIHHTPIISTFEWLFTPPSIHLKDPLFLLPEKFLSMSFDVLAGHFFNWLARILVITPHILFCRLIIDLLKTYITCLGCHCSLSVQNRLRILNRLNRLNRLEIPEKYYGFGEEDLLVSTMLFRYFVIISPWMRFGPSFE